MIDTDKQYTDFTMVFEDREATDTPGNTLPLVRDEGVECSNHSTPTI